MNKKLKTQQKKESTFNRNKSINIKSCFKGIYNKEKKSEPVFLNLILIFINFKDDVFAFTWGFCYLSFDWAYFRIEWSY